MPNFLNSKELDSAGPTRPQPTSDQRPATSDELPSTLVERTLQFQPFYAKRTQFPKSQVFTKLYITRTYENWTLGQIGKTNPIRTQFKPNRTQFRSRRFSLQPFLFGFLRCFASSSGPASMARLRILVCHFQPVIYNTGGSGSFTKEHNVKQ